MELRPKDVTVAYRPHEDGRPFIVKLTHKPTSITVEGQGKDYDEARGAAQTSLEQAVEVSGAASC